VNETGRLKKAFEVLVDNGNQKLMMTTRCIWIFTIFAAIGTQIAAAKESDIAPAGNLYLQEIIAAYASYSSYRDKGEVDIVYYEGNKKIDERRKEFSTRYTRGGFFEIKWKKFSTTGSGIEYKIWKSGNEVYSKYGLDAEFRSASLMDALSRAAGISTLLTTFVPCLLYEETGCFLCDKEAGYTVTSTVEEEDNLLRLELVDSSGNKENIWIDNKAKVLKKIEWWNERGNLRIHHRITYSDVQGSK